MCKKILVKKWFSMETAAQYVRNEKHSEPNKTMRQKSSPIDLIKQMK